MSERWLVAATEYAGLTAYTGGIGRHYAALLPALAEQGAEVDLLLFADGPLVRSSAPGIRRLTVERTDGIPRTAALVHRAVSLRRAYRAGAYDRVFLPEWMGLGAFLPRDAPLLTNLATGMRLVNEVSGLRLRDLPVKSRLPVLLQSRMEARQIRRSAGVIAISRAMRDRTAALMGPLPPVAVVRNCVDVDGVRAGASTRRLPAGWPQGQGPVILFLGRSERRKGVSDAFEAFADLSPRHPGARLVLAGAGGDPRFEPTRASLLERLPASARDRVTWLGHVGGDELYAAIAAADVVMCPSRWEGFGNVAVEVKAAGTALIVTSGSGFDDFCTDGEDCLMAPPADPAALAAAIERVLDDPVAADARAERASADVDRFAPGPVAADLRGAADQLIGGRRLEHAAR